MASGFGAFGGEGRCYKYWMSFKECMANTDEKIVCIPVRARAGGGIDRAARGSGGRAGEGAASFRRGGNRARDRSRPSLRS